MYPSISKCNTKKCSKTTITSSVNDRTFSVVNDCDLLLKNWCFSFAPGSSKLFGAQGSPSSGQLTKSVESSFLIHQGDYHDLFVCP